MRIGFKKARSRLPDSREVEKDARKFVHFRNHFPRFGEVRDLTRRITLLGLQLVRQNRFNFAENAKLGLQAVFGEHHRA